MVLSKKKILLNENLKQDLLCLGESIEQICSKPYEEINTRFKNYSEQKKSPNWYNLEQYTNKYLWYIEDEDFKKLFQI